ncbi:MAG: insulinase family protein [Lachnospiraceae bacterium]|nr:insulinase family protein [Lachnospiraceae bacterium]
MEISGYEQLKQERIDDVHSDGYLFRHKKSGARICVLSNDDENKVFYIGFRTPVPDSTGVAHILEHSVLCGSRKFPSKDPFVEMAKGSMNTFLNAMTYPDKTLYPVASCNDADFKNLMDVYMDAVFYPNIYEKEEIFRQEGWSYQLESPEDELTYNGVVYNEMKGVFSSPEDMLDREVQNSLYPDNTYSNESGGDPEYIPDLKFSEFLGFHGKYYHPSNSYIYLYGDMDVEERLGWLDKEYLSKYDAMEVGSEIVRQPAFEKMREVRKHYSVSSTDSTEDNTYFSFNASIGTSLDAKLSNAFAVLEYALLSAPGARLKQVLLDAKVGKDVMGAYDCGIYQPVFSVIVKNSNPEQKETFMRIIQEELERTVAEGLDEKALRAGINYMEFRFREADYGTFPKGLMYGINLLDSWLYDDERPFDYLFQISIFDYLKQQVGTGYFEELIREYILENPHVSLVILEPEKGMTAKKEEKSRKKLADYKASLSREEIQELVEKTKKLQEFQETPDTEEQLRTLPMLSLSDLKREAQPLYNQEHYIEETLLLHHNLFTNGIAYVNLLFDTKYVKKEYQPYLGILKATLGLIDTENYSYGELFNEINMRTGGIYASLDVFPNWKEPENYRTALVIQAKTLYGELGFVKKMVEEILFTSNLDNEKRLYEIIAQLKSRLQMVLNSSGHTTAVLHAMSYFSNVGAYNEALGGITFYKLVEDIEEHFEERKAGLIAILKELVSSLFRKDTLMVSCTADVEGFEVVCGYVKELKEKLPEGKLPVQEQIKAVGLKNEGFQNSAEIQFVARAGNYRMAGFSYTGALRVLKVIMGYGYLWENVRVKGGAYGCMSGFSYMGDSYFTSYRDPNLRQTNMVFEGAVEAVRNFTVTEREMTKYIIGTISEMDVPLTPATKGNRSLYAYMAGRTEEDFQKEREQVLGADQEAIRSLGDLLAAVFAQGAICVIGNEEKLENDKDLFKALVPFVG